MGMPGSSLYSTHYFLLTTSYRSRERPIPHALVPLPSDQIQDDLRYDVQVEMELVRPPRGQEETGQSLRRISYLSLYSRADSETGNFMLSLELRSLRNPELVVIGSSQPVS